MTLQKPLPFILLMFTVLCALPAAAAAGMIPSAFAQEEEADDENFVGSIVSKALGDDGGIAEDGEANQEDATNTGTENSNQGQTVDQDDFSAFGDESATLEDANVAEPIGVPVDVQEEVLEVVPTATPPEEEEPPELEAFCFNSAVIFQSIICFDTQQDCDDALEFLVDVFDETPSTCTGFVTPPPDAAECTFTQDEQMTSINCPTPQP